MNNTHSSSPKFIFVQEEPREASQLVEIPITQAGLGRVFIPDIPQLRNQPDQKIVIKGIRLIVNTVLQNAPTSGLALVGVAELQTMSLVLYSEGWEKGFLIPLLTLNDMDDGGTTPFRYLPTRFANWQNVDWNKSYIQYSNGTSSVGNNALVLDVQYLRLDAQGNPVIGPM